MQKLSTSASRWRQTRQTSAMLAWERQGKQVAESLAKMVAASKGVASCQLSFTATSLRETPVGLHLCCAGRKAAAVASLREIPLGKIKGANLKTELFHNLGKARVT